MSLPDKAEPDISIPKSDGASVMENHPIYYFDFVVFEVENTRFRVPKSRFLVSDPQFFDRFEIEIQGHVAESLIVLNDTTAEMFNGLVTVMYPLKKTSEITRVEWIGALDLATRWGFKDIRDEAISYLTRAMLSDASSESVIKHILLGRKYQVPAWVFEGYTRVIGKPDLDLEELQTLDPLTSAQLLNARLRITRAQLLKQLDHRPKERCPKCLPFRISNNCEWACNRPGQIRANQCGSCRQYEGDDKCIYICAYSANNTYAYGDDVKDLVKRIPLRLQVEEPLAGSESAL